MQNAEGPGDTPEWKTKLAAMGPLKRSRFALVLGVTDRTVKNWIDGKSVPSDATVERIKKQQAKKERVGLSLIHI